MNVPETPGTPSPLAAKGSNVGLNSKWLYEKGRKTRGMLSSIHRDLNGIDLFYWEIPFCLPDKRIRIVTLGIELMKSIVRIMG